MKPKFENGDKVKDKITGWKGTITCQIIYLNGCIRYSVQPTLNKDGEYVESQIIDEQQLELVKPIKKKKTKPVGGDRPAPSSFDAQLKGKL